MEAQMAALDDKITAIQSVIAQVQTDLAKLIADFHASSGQAPTAAQLAALDKIASDLGVVDTQAKAE